MMDSFIVNYFDKCRRCEEIGVRVENRNPRNRTRFAKPELTVKNYEKETTCPEFIVKGLDGIYRREVTHKDILQFGENINKKAEQIHEKRLQRALALTKNFKTKEENKDRAKLRKETKKANTKKLALIKRDQMHENTIILCEELSGAIMTLLEMHMSKKKEQAKITERVLKENYDKVWKMVEEEIKNRVEKYMETYMTDSEDEL